MSSIYYPESWMQHPEVLRLQQRVRELENGEEIRKKQKEINRKEAEIELLQSELFKYMQKDGVLEQKLETAKHKVKDLEQQIETFNQLSFIRKATFHFRID